MTKPEVSQGKKRLFDIKEMAKTIGVGWVQNVPVSLSLLKLAMDENVETFGVSTREVIRQARNGLDENEQLQEEVKEKLVDYLDDILEQAETEPDLKGREISIASLFKTG